MLRLFTARSAQTACLRGVRFNSTDVKPPMLAKLREDMKAAMRAKDKPRSGLSRIFTLLPRSILYGACALTIGPREPAAH